MKRATFTVLFFILRTKKLRDGTSPICARITVNGSRAEFRLQSSIRDKLWDHKNGCAKGKTKEAHEINEFLNMVQAKLYNYRSDLYAGGKPLTAESIKKAYFGIEETEKTILQIFKEHNDRCKSLVGIDFAQGTYERYVTCYKHVENFISFMYHKKDMALHSITPSFVKDFDFYLKTQRACSHNTATKYLKNFKKITRIALSNGWMKDDPFKNTKFHLEQVDMDFLDQEELNRLIKKKMPMERLQQVKDVYLFCCFTGLAFIDVKNLSYSDIIDKNDMPWIKKKRQKTKNWCNVPLLAPARKLIEKYKSNTYCVKTQRVFPVLSNQKMNAYLKEIATLCRIDKNLSTHTARHTFATTVTLSNQISIEVVSKMLGHSSINMTKKYARVVDDLINKDMKKIYGKFEQIRVS